MKSSPSAKVVELDVMQVDGFPCFLRAGSDLPVLNSVIS